MTGRSSRLLVARKYALGFCSAILIFLLTDFMAELAYRNVKGHSWRRRGAVALRQAIDKKKQYRISDPIFHHTLAPLASAESPRWGHKPYKFHTNSLGFRDREPRIVPLEATKRRILFIGDSFTEGIGINFEDTFVGIVSRSLESEAEVLNAGVSSYSPVIYARKVLFLLENRGLQFDELIVMLDISDAQDEAEGYELDSNGHVVTRPPSFTSRRRLQVRRLPGERILLQRTIVTSWILRKARRRARPSRKVTGSSIDSVVAHGPNGVHWLRGAWTFDPNLLLRYGLDGLSEMSRHMASLQGELLERDIGLTVVVYPWPLQILALDRASLQVEFWRSWCRSRSVPFVDLFPEFIDLAEEKGIEPVIRENFIPGDVHWNEQGHSLVAKALVEKVPSFFDR